MPAAKKRIDATPAKNAVGRPTKYKPEFVEQARKLCMLGATDMELADFFSVNVLTIYRWQHEHEDFCKALTSGKELADERVERSFYNRAVGYTFDSVKIFMPSGASEPVHAHYREHVPPDTGACMSWLKNRRKETWRDKQDIDHNVSFAVVKVNETDERI